MQGQGRRVEELRDAPHGAGPRDGVVLPAELTDHEVARRIARIVAPDDLADGLRGHHVADLEALRVGALRAPAPALVRINGDPEVADEDLPGARLADLGLVDCEIRLRGEAGRPRRHRHAPVSGAYLNRHAPPPSNSFRIRRLTTMRCTSSGPS